MVKTTRSFSNMIRSVLFPSQPGSADAPSHPYEGGRPPPSDVSLARRLALGQALLLGDGGRAGDHNRLAPRLLDFFECALAESMRRNLEFLFQLAVSQHLELVETPLGEVLAAERLDVDFLPGREHLVELPEIDDGHVDRKLVVEAAF